MDQRTFLVKPPSGWYRVPDDPTQQRFWNGVDWEGKPRRDMHGAKDFPGIERMTAEELERRGEKSAAKAAAEPEREAAIADLAYWQQRLRFLDHLASEARQRHADAARRVQAMGIGREELASWRPPATSPGNAASTGGFFFAYSESGPDLDGDGLVDGGLFESISDLF